MKYYELYPEVAGSVYEDSITNINTRPIEISFMHYEFDGWLGDDLLTEAGHFIVTKELAVALQHNSLTGFNIQNAVVSKSEHFVEMYPNRELPNFKWLIINGEANKHDFWFSKETMMLNVSENALAVLKEFQIENCDIEGL